MYIQFSQSDRKILKMGTLYTPNLGFIKNRKERQTIKTKTNYSGYILYNGYIL